MYKYPNLLIVYFKYLKFVISLSFEVLMIKHKALHMLEKHSATELQLLSPPIKLIQAGSHCNAKLQFCVV